MFCVGSDLLAVTAVVLNWKDPVGTSRCVESLLTPGGPGQVIVVDNESSGSLRQFAAAHTGRVQLIESRKNLGFAAGVNLGINSRSPGTRYLLLMNNDAELAPGCLDLLIRHAVRRPEAGIIAPVIRFPDGRLQSAGHRFRPTTGSVLPLAAGSIADFATFACVLLPIDVLHRVGTLDEGFFMYWEDVEYCLRCRRFGLETHIVPDATVLHRLSASHGRAGGWIDAYSMMGLAVLARRLGGTAYCGLAWRAMLRLGVRVLRGEWAASRWVMRGLKLGLAAGSGSGHAAVDELRSAVAARS
ncbi:glycosyltransferase family 2 protein [Arthrobacter sp. CAU 1506]|nr:glycosyltransferase family 2 protein [Arthrobacter sp. CAU 1506]